MSKSGNVVDPWDHFNKEGSDSIRWYMTTQVHLGADQFRPNGVRVIQGSDPLNVYRSMQTTLQWIDLTPKTKVVSLQYEKESLDRWVLSRASAMAEAYHQHFENWDFHKAGRELEDFSQ